MGLALWGPLLVGNAQAPVQDPAPTPDFQQPVPATSSPQPGARAATSPRALVVEDEVPVPARDFQPPGVNLPREHIFGDWLGLRPRLEDDGITTTLTWVSDMMGNPVGGLRQGFTECDNLGLDTLFDLDKLCQIPGAKFHVSMSQRSGSSLTDVYIGNVFNVQQVFGGETYRLVDLAYRQSLFDDKLNVRLGRMAVGDEFLTSPYYWMFIQNGIDGNPVGIFNNAPGMTAYPTATWGVRIKVKPTDRTYVRSGFYNGDPTLGQNQKHGVDFTMNGPLFAITEAGYRPNSEEGDTGLPGNYKIGAYYNGGSFSDFNGRVLGPSAAAFGLVPQTTQGNCGFYLLADQIYYQMSDPEGRRWLGVFGSFLFAPDQEINLMPFFFNGGFVFRGLFPSRPTDFGGFGVIFGEFSSDLRDAQRLAQRQNPSVGVQSNEMALEWTYAFRIREGRMIFQPDIQYIIRPGAAGLIPNALAIGLQLALNF